MERATAEWLDDALPRKWLSPGPLVSVRAFKCARVYAVDANTGESDELVWHRGHVRPWVDA